MRLTLPRHIANNIIRHKMTPSNQRHLKECTADGGSTSGAVTSPLGESETTKIQDLEHEMNQLIDKYESEILALKIKNKELRYRLSEKEKSLWC